MSKIKKIKKPSLKVLQKKIWEECKRIIKIRYGNDCYTCEAKNIKGSNRHTGHMIPKKYLPYVMKYDLRLLRPQCYNCNMNLGGMGAFFFDNILREYEGSDVGWAILDDCKYNKTHNLTPKQAQAYYIDLLEYFKIVKGQFKLDKVV